MTPQQFSQKLTQQAAQVKQYIERDAPRIAGIEAVNHFKKSFLDGGFTDSSLVPRLTINNEQLTINKQQLTINN